MFRWSIVALTLSLFPLTGCETKEVWLELPSFGSGNVDGVWLWRLSDTADSYERACRIPFNAVVTTSDGESVGYEQDCSNGHDGVPLHAALQRSATDPDTVTLGIFYMRWEDPGVYKVSSYGADGESALSDTTLEL